jgi:hypothetical protein
VSELFINFAWLEHPKKRSVAAWAIGTGQSILESGARPVLIYKDVTPQIKKRLILILVFGIPLGIFIWAVIYKGLIEK